MRFKIRVLGKVQGVWFRRFVQLEAERLGLTGFVQNLPDGSVYIEAQGPKKSLERLVQSCKRGPDGVWVKKVEFELMPLLKDSRTFEIVQ